MNAPDARRSVFVTGFGWTFVGLGALGALYWSLMAGLVAAQQHSATDGSRLGKAYTEIGEILDSMPGPWGWLYAHQLHIMLGMAAWSLLHLACALGLLARRNGARLAFVALLLLDIALNLAAIPYRQHVIAAAQMLVDALMQQRGPSRLLSWMHHMMAFQRLEQIAQPVLLALVLAWLAWALCRPRVRQAFATSRLR